MNYMLDKDFLKQLDEDNLKQCYVKIEVLDSEEKPISDIVGRVSTGNININGSSSLRRTASLTFVADEVDNDLTDVDNLLSISKRIALYVGFENNIDLKYDDIVYWDRVSGIEGDISSLKITEEKEVEGEEYSLDDEDEKQNTTISNGIHKAPGTPAR